MLILKLCCKHMTFHEGTVYALELDFLIEFCSEYLLKMQVSKICECRFRKNFNLMWHCRLLWCQKPKGQPTLLTAIFSSSHYLVVSTYVRTILQYYCSSVLFLALLVSLKYYQTVHYVNNVVSIQSIGSFCKKPKTR